MYMQELYLKISLVFNLKKTFILCHISSNFLNFIFFIRVKFARNLASFMSQMGRCLVYWVFWMTDAGGKHNTGLLPTFIFSTAYLEKNDSS